MFKSKKKLTGLVLLLAGVVLFIFAKYEINRVGNAKEMVSRGTSMFSGNAAGSAVDSYAQGKLSAYDAPLMLCEIGGIVLIVLGAGMIYFGRKKS
ncbi:MAG TPA: hypothetical protein VHK67_04055 [Rhabdochlamydiaceae bacterium]|jgi:hypothetical protein|nr:hypothetical protein [Rhabdochlamydiaceae bacterium]